MGSPPGLAKAQWHEVDPRRSHPEHAKRQPASLHQHYKALTGARLAYRNRTGLHRITPAHHLHPPPTLRLVQPYADVKRPRPPGR